MSEEPCWQQPDNDSGLCANCQKPWPQCFTDEGLDFLFMSGDMLDSEDIELLEAEIQRRELPL